MHGSALGQARLTELLDSDPWVSRFTFTALALDLPNRLNEDGFVKLGSLAWSIRPCIKFLSVGTYFKTRTTMEDNGRQCSSCTPDVRVASFDFEIGSHLAALMRMRLSTENA